MEYAQCQLRDQPLVLRTAFPDRYRSRVDRVPDLHVPERSTFGNHAHGRQVPLDDEQVRLRYVGRSPTTGKVRRVLLSFYDALVVGTDGMPVTPGDARDDFVYRFVPPTPPAFCGCRPLGMPLLRAAPPPLPSRLVLFV